MSLHVASRNASAESGRRRFTATPVDGKAIAVESSTGMRMPDDVAAAARAALGGGEIRHEFAWMSWAGTVWRLEGESKSIYVKRAAHLDEERDLVENDRLSALVDVGRARVDSPRIDFAAAIWSLQYNFGPGFAQMFLDAYGTPPLTEREIERLRRSYSRR